MVGLSLMLYNPRAFSLLSFLDKIDIVKQSDYTPTDQVGECLPPFMALYRGGFLGEKVILTSLYWPLISSCSCLGKRICSVVCFRVKNDTDMGLLWSVCITFLSPSVFLPR